MVCGELREEGLLSKEEGERNSVGRRMMKRCIICVTYICRSVIHEHKLIIFVELPQKLLNYLVFVMIRMNGG